MRVRELRRDRARWRTGALCAYLIVATTLTACERSTPTAPQKPRALHDALIVVIGPSEDHPQWPGIRGGAERFFANVSTLRGDCVAPREATAAGLRDTVERTLERHPNVICLHVADAAAARASIYAIAAHQALLVTMGEAAGDPRVAAHVGVDLAAAAELLGSSLTQVAAGRQSYLLLHEDGRSETATNCYRRFAAAAQRQYGVTLLQEASAATGERTPAQLVEEMLGLFPHAGLVVTLAPDVWLTPRAGWHRQLRKLNAEFRFATLSAAPALWPLLGTPDAPGEAAALVGPLDGDIGYAAMQTATQLLISTEKLASRVTIPCELVTPANLPDFARRYSEAANGLDVSAYMPGRATAPAETEAE